MATSQDNTRPVYPDFSLTVDSGVRPQGLESYVRYMAGHSRDWLRHRAGRGCRPARRPQLTSRQQSGSGRP